MLSYLLHLILTKRPRSDCSRLLTQQVDFDELKMMGIFSAYPSSMQSILQICKASIVTKKNLSVFTLNTVCEYFYLPVMPPKVATTQMSSNWKMKNKSVISVEQNVVRP